MEKIRFRFNDRSLGFFFVARLLSGSQRRVQKNSEICDKLNPQRIS